MNLLLRAFTALVVTFLSVSATLVTPRETSYDGTKVLRVTADSQDVVKLKSLINDLNLEYWSDEILPNVATNIMVPQDKVASFQAEFPHFDVVHEDLGADIRTDAGGFAAQSFADSSAVADLTWFTRYHDYNDHLAWLNELQSQFSNMSSIVTSGDTVEGRTITGIHIFGSGGSGSKPAVLFHGNVHAREWVTSMTVEYFAYQLLTQYSDSNTVKDLVENYDFYLFPVVNPDGFRHSQTSTRLWRKNRSAGPPGTSCIGTDINRNWPTAWGQRQGASTDCRDEDYKGTSPGSTPEIQGLIKFASGLSSGNGIALYIDWHSFGQLFLYPWGYSCTVESPNASRYRTLGNAFASAVRAVRNTSYRVIQSCDLYVTSGGSHDHFVEALNTTNAFAVELPTDTFILPAGEISGVVRETYEGMLALVGAL